jgi:hypothetical protein
MQRIDHRESELEKHEGKCVAFTRMAAAFWRAATASRRFALTCALRGTTLKMLCWRTRSHRSEP